MYVHKKKCNFLHNGRLIDGSNNELALANELSNDLIIKLLNDNKDMREIIIKQQDHMMKQQNQKLKWKAKTG